MSGVDLRYVASSGNSYNLRNSTLKTRADANFHKWNWGVNATPLQFGGRVSAFTRPAIVYEATLTLFGTTKSNQELLGMLHDDFENDVRSMKPGRLIWGSYYIECYATASETTPDNNVAIDNKVSFYCPYPFWIQEQKIELVAQQIEQSGYLDFSFDFPFDFTAPVVGTKIIPSDFPFSSEFRIVIYGQAVNPRIVVNGHPYVLYTTIPQGAYVLVDSKSKTIVMYGSDGERTNMFNFRNKTDSIFTKIPGGNLTITWDASFGADITVFRERSEPRFEVTT